MIKENKKEIDNSYEDIATRDIMNKIKKMNEMLNINKTSSADQTNPIYKKITTKSKAIPTFQETNTSPFIISKKILTKESRPVSKERSTSKPKQKESNTSKKSLISASSIQLNNSINSNVQNKTKKIISSFDLMRGGFSAPGIRKNNQDNYFHYKNFNGLPNHMFFGVCDGHGIIGHEVSLFLRNNLPKIMEQHFRFNNLSLEKVFLKNQKNKMLVYNTIKEVFLSVNALLNSKIDTVFSGSTCCSLFFTGEQIISVNSGDSRAVLGKKKGNKWSHVDITKDHKPDDQSEKLRIIQCGGRVEPHKDENGEYIGPSRVWLKEQDLPGLAMSRSFGDQLAASVGTTCEPEIFEYNFEPEDKFLIVASDGIWEFISSSNAVDIIKDYYENNDPKGCCEFLLKESSNRWIKEEKVIDDISMIILFFD